MAPPASGRRAVPAAPARPSAGSRRAAATTPRPRRTLPAASPGPSERSREPLAGKPDELLRHARLGASARAGELDIPRRLEPLDARDRKRPRREISLDRDARDERGAEAAEHRGARRLL